MDIETEAHGAYNHICEVLTELSDSDRNQFLLALIRKLSWLQSCYEDGE